VTYIFLEPPVRPCYIKGMETRDARTLWRRTRGKVLLSGWVDWPIRLGDRIRRAQFAELYFQTGNELFSPNSFGDEPASDAEGRREK